MEIIEYIRKNGRKPKRNDDGKIVVKGNGSGRQKKGVLYCTVNPNISDMVMVGFSLCNNMDDFDYVNGQHEPGFGLGLAKDRAEKWSDYDGYFIQNSWTEKAIECNDDLIGYVNPDPKTIVEIPPSVIGPLRDFIKRCRRYFQDKEFPEWIKNVELYQETAITEYINYTMEVVFDE